MSRLQDKVCIITGAASGMGREETNLFLNEGATVIAVDNNYHSLQSAFKKRDNLILKDIDITNIEDWKRLTNYVQESFNKLDVLVNNAGVYITHSFEEFSIELWNKIMNVNALGTMLGMQSTIPLMREEGGSIINISSIDANIGTGNSYIYTASKGAVRSLTKKMAIEFANHKIRINSVHPGLVKTPMTEEQINSEGGSYAQFNTPLKEIGKPEDIAYGVLYLASEESKFMTGAELIIDGGITAI